MTFVQSSGCVAWCGLGDGVGCLAVGDVCVCVVCVCVCWLRCVALCCVVFIILLALLR